MSRVRLDQELVKRRMVPSRNGARRAILDGQVVIDGEVATRPSQHVAAGVDIEISAEAGRYVGRGALKLKAALDHFGVDVTDRTAIDVGASTGGFTDVLLQSGASHVVALDVGHDQLHQQLRSDPRVTVVERANIRHADPQALGAPFDVVVADLSFISLRLIAEVFAGLGGERSDWLLLVKPQFEVGAAEIGKGGVVRSATVQGQALDDVAGAFAGRGLTTVGAMASPIAGSAGNREALLWLRRAGEQVTSRKLFKVLGDV
jgi:23S rRNA (cytidine1920-2'-O)/16S rRNA (cytidine1409-2'-O)-methyltransferase